MRPVATYTVVSSLPEPLKRLSELAYNVRWSWDHQTIELFRRIDSDLWEETGHNPVRLLGMIPQSRLNAVAMDESFIAHMERVLEGFDEYLSDGKRAWYAQEFGQEASPQIAYFSFEFGLTEAIPIYSGGLGVLAGDHLKAASDLNIPLIGVGLLYQQGYFRQYLNADGWQQETYPENDFYTMPLRQVRGADGQALKIAVDYPGRQVWARIWQVSVGRVSLYLLDTNIPDNPNQDDQNLTDQLYGGDREWRIKQEILLGIGGLRALYAMGIEPSVCHMNEGHAAFMSLERARILMERQRLSFHDAATITSASNVFTTHTPVPAGNDYFAPALVEGYFSQYRQGLGLSENDLLALGRINPGNAEEDFCMTVLALHMSAFANGVSRLHGEVACKMWQNVYPQVPLNEIPIHSVTNGVHLFTWVSRDLAGLYDRYLGPKWREEPTDLAVWQRINNIPSEELWRVHELRRERLVAYVRRRLVAQLENRGASPAEIESAQDVLNPEVLTIGFARRFATYKRATLLLHDIDRFQGIVCGEHPVQFVFAGKAHPHDSAGKEFIRQLVHFAQESNCRNRIVFLEDYDMSVARYMVQGVDVWLNTPRRPLEASGTSGMKAALNGVLNLSVLDGWWAEAYRPTLGWAIGKGEEYEDEALQDYVESNAVYELMERDMIPTFYDHSADNLPRGWIARMKRMLVELAPVFNTSRMVQEYTRRFYQPAMDSYRLLSPDNFSEGRAYASWYSSLQTNWSTIKLDSMNVDAGEEMRVGEPIRVTAEAFLGSINPGDVAVECYEGQLDKDGNIKRGHSHTMTHMGEGKKKGWHQYAVEINTSTTGLHGLTVRVLPAHQKLPKTIRLGLIRWAAD